MLAVGHISCFAKIFAFILRTFRGSTLMAVARSDGWAQGGDGCPDGLGDRLVVCTPGNARCGVGRRDLGAEPDGDLARAEDPLLAGGSCRR